MNDWLAAEPLIKARLEDQVPDVTVLAAADLAGVTERQQITPAVHLLYGGDVPVREAVGTAERGAGQITDQRWVVVIATRSARDVVGGSGARQLAGPIVAQTLDALRGWTPDGFTRPLRRGSGMPPKYSPGFAYFPFQFLLRIVE